MNEEKRGNIEEKWMFGSKQNDMKASSVVEIVDVQSSYEEGGTVLYAVYTIGMIVLKQTKNCK